MEPDVARSGEPSDASVGSRFAATVIVEILGDQGLSIVTPNGFNQLRFNFSGLGCWLTLLLFAWLLGSIGLGWLVKSLVVIIGLVTIAPVLIFFGLRFWLKQNLVQADCPVCNFNLTGIRNTETLCPNCGTPLKAEDGAFRRITDDSTIDVQAVDVIDVTVEQLPTSSEGQDA